MEGGREGGKESEGMEDLKAPCERDINTIYETNDKPSLQPG
jgi:hypothetical protein